MNAETPKPDLARLADLDFREAIVDLIAQAAAADVLIVAGVRYGQGDRADATVISREGNIEFDIKGLSHDEGDALRSNLFEAVF